MNSDQIPALAPLVVIAVTTVTVMLAIAFKRHFALASGFAAGGMSVALLTLYAAPRSNSIQATVLLRIDAYAQFAMALLLLAGLATVGFCYAYFKDREGENEECVLLLLTALLGSLVLVDSSHFAAFFLGLETLSVSLFVLVGYALRQPRSLEAAIKYLLLSGVSSALLLMGMALIYAQCGALDFYGVGECIAVQRDTNVAVVGGMALLLAGLGFKMSLVPFHMWTPDVYEGAPAPVAGFVATASKGAVFMLLLRIFHDTGAYIESALTTALSIVAVLSIFGGNLLALLQSNVKRLLAYSSIAHMGYLLVVFIAGRVLPPALLFEAAGFYLAAYFVTTLGAFGVVSVLSAPQQEADALSCYRGLFWRRPWLAASFTLMLLSLAGIPLTVGFIGKFYVFIAAVDGRLWGLLAAVVVGSGLGLYYYLRIIVAMMHSEVDTAAPANAALYHWPASAVLLLLTVLLVWLGVFPSGLVDFIASAAAAEFK
ncbi:MAG: NADH-quinone oxidoreductase subunit N [Gammaproteobacteria bacterium]